jgi:hypothetical protein
MLKDYGDSGPDSIPDSPWISSTSSSCAGPGMIGSGVERLELPVDFLVQVYIDRYVATRNYAHV